MSKRDKRLNVSKLTAREESMVRYAVERLCNQSLLSDVLGLSQPFRRRPNANEFERVLDKLTCEQ